MLSFPSYPKIPGPYKRDPDDPKKIINSSFADERISYLARLRWNAYEKIDGTNIRLCWDNHKVTVEGRTSTSQHNPGLLAFLEERYTKNAEFEELLEQACGHPVMIVGEGFGGNVQKVGPHYGEYQFRAFDVWSPSVGWWRKDSGESFCSGVGVPIAPLIANLDLRDIINHVRSERTISTLGNPDPEGYVCSPGADLYNQFGAPIRIKVKPTNV